MKKITFQILFILLQFVAMVSFGQNNQKPSLITTAVYMKEAPSIQSRINQKTFISPAPKNKEVNPRRGTLSDDYDLTTIPKDGDPLMLIQSNDSKQMTREPTLTFDALQGGNATPTDPTGAVGPNHYVSAYNSGFRIYDRQGNPLTPHASLANIWPNETLGDPIVLYDRYVDRWMITQFSRSPNGILIAYSQGPNPITSGWNTYRFNTGTFPDYPKYAIWADGIYMTANKDPNSPTNSEVVYVFERDLMINGANNPQSIGFPLPGIINNGFYSPLPFHADGTNGLPPVGTPNFIAYMQDNVWNGITVDHIKLWEVTVDWGTPNNSTIAQAPVEIPVTAFDGLFDGGSFSNLPQPSGQDIDALQATMMYMMPYYRFDNHNSVLMNWVVDLNGNDDYSGIRWVELRQQGDGQPWTLHQEGTYTLQDDISRFCGSMAMDKNGNIGLAYTVVSPTTFPSLRYTGRLANDPLGQMTIPEEEHATGTSINPHSRYGDYGQLVLDPTDDLTFWHIGEYFNNGDRNNGVAAFRINLDCTTNLTINQNINSGETDIQQAAETLTATNTIFSGGTANYNAGTRVRLLPGFRALQGSFFRGFIEGCTTTNGSLLANTTTEEIVYTDNDENSERLENIIQEESISIYPNPTTGLITIKSQEKLLSYTVSNSFGKPLLRKKIANLQGQIDLTGLSKGIYMLELTTEKGDVIRKKILKE